MSEQIVTEDTWAADMLYGTEPSSAPPTTSDEVDDDTETGPERENSDPHDMSVELDAPQQEQAVPDTSAGAKKAAMILALGVIGAIAVTAVLLLSSRETPAPQPTTAAPPVLAPATPPQSESPRASDNDQAIPYTASANCPAGSTSAQALTDTSSDSAWVCVRGPQDAAVDGQVLHIDFGRSYVIAAATVTPGWVAKTPGGKDEWLQHRVVTRLQYVFNDTDRTVVTHDTGNTHGPVTIALPKKVLASRATVLILQTARPPASPFLSAEPDVLALNGFGDSMLGPDGSPLQPDTTSSTDQNVSSDESHDPVDATFAMSQLTFLGHEPN